MSTSREPKRETKTRPSPSFGQQTLFKPCRRGQWDCRYRIPNLLVSKRGTVFAFPEERVIGLGCRA